MQSHSLSRRRAWLVAVVATLAMSVSYVDRQVVAVMAASVRRAMQIDAEQFGWLAAVFSASYLVCAPVAGRLIDRIGARRGLPAAVLAWSVVAASHALAPSFPFCSCRARSSASQRRPRFRASRRACSGHCRRETARRPSGSSSQAAHSERRSPDRWRSRSTRDSGGVPRSASRRSSGRPGCHSGSWSLATQTSAALSKRQPPSTRSPRDAGAPRSPLIRDPAVLRALALVVGSAPVLMFVLVWLPQYLTLGRSVAESRVSRPIWLPPMMADAGMVGFGALAGLRDRARGPGRSHVGLVLLAAAMASLLTVVSLVENASAATFVLGLAAAGAGGMYTLLTADMLSRVNPARVSAASGLTAAAQSLTYVVLNPIVGRWVDASHSFDGSLRAIGAMALPAAVAWALWPMGPGGTAATTRARPL